MNKKDSIKKYYYNVVPAHNYNGTLSYCSEINLKFGSIVTINLRKKIVLGCIVKKLIKKPEGNFKIKSILEYSPYYFLDKKIIDFFIWLSNYNICSLGASLKLILLNTDILKTEHDNYFKINKNYNLKLTNKQTLFLKLINNNSFTEQILISKKNYRKSFINNLVKKNIIIKKQKIKSAIFNIRKEKFNLNKLTDHQEKIYTDILHNLNDKNFKPLYLDGTTGSGKTEVYFKIIKYFLERKKQVLVLIPEIALSTQWVTRFENAFNFKPNIWNSGIRKSEKRLIWQSAIKGETMIVVGARSSIFLPFSNLGLIIVDEENDISYKQEDQLIYNARDMAIVKSKINKSNIILVSATPSIETYYNYITNKYSYKNLYKRFGAAKSPKIKVINMKNNNKFFSQELIDILERKLKRKKQVLVLINRRGYAPIKICIKCGRKKHCKYCDVNLVYHKNKKLMICHHCGYSEQLSTNCSFCHKENTIISLGFGIEKVTEELKSKLKNFRMVSLSSDSINNANFTETLKKIENGSINLIIGTQIISKGFNFLKLNSVFILDFDCWFYSTDIRTNEKIFQLTQQVSGRTSRDKETGEVYIQTYDKNNYLLKALIANDRESFYKNELSFRRTSNLPPYTKLIAIILLGKEIAIVRRISENIKNYLETHKNLTVLGPIPAPIEYIRKEYRYRILIKTNQPFLAQNIIRKHDFNKLCIKSVKIKVDVDPLSFF